MEPFLGRRRDAQQLHRVFFIGTGFGMLGFSIVILVELCVARPDVLSWRTPFRNLTSGYNGARCPRNPEWGHVEIQMSFHLALRGSELLT